MMYTKYTDEMWRSAKTVKEAEYWGRQKELEMKCYFEEIENEWTLFDVTADNRLVTRRYFGEEIGEKKMNETRKEAVEILEKAMSELEKIHNNQAKRGIRTYDDTRRKILSKNIDEERRNKIAENVIKAKDKIAEAVEKTRAIGFQKIIHNI